MSESRSEPDGPVIEHNGITIDSPSALDAMDPLDRGGSLMHDEFETHNLSQGETNQPDIDVVHVMGVSAEEERLSLNTLIAKSVESRRRELVFNSDIASLVTGDFTIDSIEYQALQLLRKVTIFQEPCDSLARRVIVFVAYDLGALIVKKAISIAGFDQPQWPGIFTGSARFIFSGCFQRRDDTQVLEMKLFEFLHAKKDKIWAHLLTPMSIKSLASASMDMSELFIGSKITLRSRIFSLYANENTAGKIHPVFDYFTATLGLPVELPVQEETQNEQEPFPNLGDKICFQVEYWIPPSWKLWEQSLLSLAFPHRQLLPMSLLHSHPVLVSSEHKNWMTSRGLRILYIHGKDHRATREAAEQAFLYWQLKHREGKVYEPKLLSFSFSSRDPARDSMIDMISSFYIQLFSGYITDITETADGDHFLLQDQFQLQHGWTEEDLLKLFVTEILDEFGPDTLLLLQDLDECDKKSRTAFLTFLSRRAATTEEPLKFLVTSRRCCALMNDFKDLPDIPVDEYAVSTRIEESNNTSEDDYLATLISSVCPGGHGKAQIRKSLEKLVSMDKDMLDMILKLIKGHTNWPKEPSTKTLSTFCSLLEVTSSSSTSLTVLDQILRSIPDQDGLRWILNWLLRGYRPLTKRELAMILCHCKRGDEQTLATPSHTDLQDALFQLETWLRGIVEFSHDQVCLRDDVWDLLRGDMNYIWNEVRATASETILQFLLAYLAAPEVQERLNSMYRQYQSQVASSEDNITPPLVPDGQHIIFYAVQAFPSHLSENTDLLKTLERKLITPDGPLTPWAKVYWAMSNPFLRPRMGTLVSVCETLLALGNLGPSAFTILENFERPTKLGKMDYLVEAVRIGDEKAALSHANQLILAPKGQQKPKSDTESPEKRVDISWPSSVLWRATWLNMDRLVSLLLENDMDPDPVDNTSSFFPSPLYMASRLGHHLVVNALINHGAKIDVLRRGEYSSLYAAAGNGHIDVIKAFVAKDFSLLELQQPHTPLYIASVWGSWKAVETLLALNADPDMGIRPGPNFSWAPLVAASEAGYVKTVQILLKNNANPNICGPSNQDTPLWFAAVRAASVECIRLLLDKGADPNHELIRPPLLIEMIKSDVPVECRLAMFDVLVNNKPPVRLDSVDPENGITTLMYAAQKGETSVVRWLLEHGVDVNITDRLERGALFYAIKERHMAVVRELLQWKPQLDILTTSGETLLQMAIEDVSVIEMLLDAGANAELCNGYGKTIINDAVAWNRLEVVRLLVNRGVNIHHRDSHGWSPILDATGYVPNAEITRILAEGGANLKDTTTHGSTPLHFATIRPEPEILKILLEFHKTIDMEKRDNNGETPLLASVQLGNVKSVILLVRAGADINAQNSTGWTILMKAVNNHLPAEAVDFLLSQPEIKINLYAKGYGAALHIACLVTKLDHVTKLIKHGADANQHVPGFPSTPLIAACLSNSTSREENLDEIERIVRVLVAHDADVNAMHGHSLYNALCTASLAAGISIINYLVDEGASVQRPDPLGRLPIHFAAANGIRNFETMILAHRGDLMISDHAGKNVLHWAAQFGHVETVEAILGRLGPSAWERTKYINHPDVDGWTPLCWATRPFYGGWATGMASEPREFARTIRYLLKHGADRFIEFRMGEGDAAETFVPLKLAELCDAGDEIIRLLTHGVNESPSINAENRYKNSGKSVQKYNTSLDRICNICLTAIFGCVHECQSCPEFDACKKCYGRIDMYHGHLKVDDGELHEFRIRGEEFYPSPPCSPRSPASEHEKGERPDGRRLPEAEPGEEVEISEVDILEKTTMDEIEISLSDLNDLDNLYDSSS